MNTISFVEAEQALRSADAAVTIAEGHGCLCGALCTLSQFSGESWLQELLPEPAGQLTSLPLGDVLTQVHTQTQVALRGDEMEFAPLLPDDSAPIGERIAALAQWAQGFLYGFGIGAPNTNRSNFPGDVSEVLKDLAEIARANDTEATGSDDEEEAYVELVEYLRAAVQLIHDEFADLRAQQGKQSPLAH